MITLSFSGGTKKAHYRINQTILQPYSTDLKS